MSTRRVALMFAVTVVGAPSAAAQDRGQAGIVMGYPPSIGIIWHVTDGVAIRPEVSFTRTTGDTTTVLTVSTFPAGTVTTTSQMSTNTSWQIGVGVSALFYVGRWDALRTYLAPRVAYSKGGFSSTVSNAPVGSFDGTTSSYSAAGSFGAQYSLAERFGVFGDVGLGYTRGRTGSGAVASSKSTSNTVSTRSAVGVILYF
jgi:hypothetical protein